MLRNEAHADPAGRVRDWKMPKNEVLDSDVGLDLVQYRDVLPLPGLVDPAACGAANEEICFSARK